jgi:hypothetical protein
VSRCALHLPDAVDIHAAVAVETLIYRVYGMMSTRVNKNMKVRSLRERHHPGCAIGVAFDADHRLHQTIDHHLLTLTTNNLAMSTQQPEDLWLFGYG